MNRKTIEYYLIIWILFLNTIIVTFGCLGHQSTNHLYRNALEDAIWADSSEICTHLTAITPANPDLIWSGNGDSLRVLMTTWTHEASRYHPGDTLITDWAEIWVTAFPDVQHFFIHHPTDSVDLILRAEQLIGLPANSGYTHFIELWVKPGDLFRPSADNEISDSIAYPGLPSDSDSSYREWFNRTILESYFSPYPMPWTRLGYTYDWGNPNHEIGLSEFVIRRNSQIIVHRITPSNDYLHIPNTHPFY